MTCPRVLLVDDKPEILALCAQLLSQNYEIAGTATGGESAIVAFEETNPDVVVLDISMPGLNGIEVAKRLRNSARRAAIIFLSGDMEFAAAALDAGGSGFVTKTRIGSDLRIALKEVLAGRTFLSPP